MWRYRDVTTLAPMKHCIGLLIAFIPIPLLADESAANVSNQIIEIPIDRYDRDHWAYEDLTSPSIPVVTRSNWPRNPIDHFVLAKLEAESLQPARRANRLTLLRRLCFDLTGLPPTERQARIFLDDQRPGAYRRLVNQLLTSPQYGRRWGQYWLDLARFAETDGFEHDKIRLTAWKYRDWVIAAFNNDLPFDQFVQMQIAGDVMHPDDEDAKIATAFCLSGPDMPDINSQDERKHVLMNEVTATVGAVFLSLQIGCAQCHDHKYDAISQADFYRLRAFFDPAVQLKPNKSVTTLDHAAAPNAISRLFHRGDWRRPGPIVPAAFPRVADPVGVSLVNRRPGSRRVELAKWLTDGSQPLTPRSIVNRIWQHHFGRGLSATPSDFGVMGEPPTHPALLDYLASKFIAGGWSLKTLHREIVMSATYQQSSVPPTDAPSRASWAKAVQSDPENELLGRFRRRRLDAESIRDAMLAVSEQLVHEAGGPGVSPPLPQEMVKTLKKGQWVTSPREADHFRRSIYIFARRNLRYPLFATFDRPAANCSCAIRHPSTTAVQSLLLLNSELTQATAGRLANNVMCTAADRQMQCVAIYRRIFCRDPEPIELKDCVEFLERQTSMLTMQGNPDPPLAALTGLCRAMFNSNEFLYVD